jgi:hypothetical protein
MPTKADHKELLDAARPFYAQLLLAQGGKCPLCDRPEPPNKKLDLDHDHKLMHIRGLLCWRCNKFLHPWMTPEWLRRAATYVEEGAANVDAGDYLMLRKTIGPVKRGATGVILRQTEEGWVRVRGPHGTFEAPVTSLSRLVRQDALEQ